MLARLRPRRRLKPAPWHAAFMAMLPAIVTHAKIAFRHLRKAQAQNRRKANCSWRWMGGKLVRTFGSFELRRRKAAGCDPQAAVGFLGARWRPCVPQKPVRTTEGQMPASAPPKVTTRQVYKWSLLSRPPRTNALIKGHAANCYCEQHQRVGLWHSVSIAGGQAAGDGSRQATLDDRGAAQHGGAQHHRTARANSER
jgi:hypothetical protein